MSRSAFVRVVRHHTGVTYELVGVVRHRPFRRSISLRTATALASSGTPLVVRRCRCAADTTDPPDLAGSVAHPPTATVR